MLIKLLSFALIFGLTCQCQLGNAQTDTSVTAPEGFEAISNGSDLEGWYAMPTEDLQKFASLSEEERQTKIAELERQPPQSWRVAEGQIVNDGSGICLTTKREFRDFELLIDFRLATLEDGCGVYLKGAPLDQWGTKHEALLNHGSQKGAGALKSNSQEGPESGSLAHAAKPAGQWNTARIIQVGARTCVWLNEQKIVDHQVMDNHVARDLPLSVRGPLQLQTHGGKTAWRNVFVRDIKSDEAIEILSAAQNEGYKSIFNGNDFLGWAGPVDQYEINDGVIRCKPESGGTIFTEKEYSDFSTRFEFKLPPGGNNGLAIRYPGKGDTAYVGMCELQVLDDTSDKYSGLDARQYHGSAYGMAAASRGYLRPVGEWNFEQVTVVGSTIRVELNGSVILKTDLSKINEFLDDKAHPGKDHDSGHFGLAGHSDPVEFRNIFVKEIDANTPAK